MTKTPRQRRALYRQLADCGEWLALFHGVTESRDDPSALRRVVTQEFHQNLAAARRAGFDAELSERVAEAYRRQAAAVGEHGLAVVGHHCDFGPYNVLQSSNATTVIDFEGLQKGFIYNDLCYFLGMIEGMGPHHLSRALSRRVSESFLAGYERLGRIDRPQLDLFMLTEMAKIMASTLGAERQAGWVARWLHRRNQDFFAAWFRERVG